MTTTSSTHNLYRRPNGLRGVGFLIAFAGKRQHSVAWAEGPGTRHTDDELERMGIDWTPSSLTEDPPAGVGQFMPDKIDVEEIDEPTEVETYTPDEDRESHQTPPVPAEPGVADPAGSGGDPANQPGAETSSSAAIFDGTERKPSTSEPVSDWSGEGFDANADLQRAESIAKGEQPDAEPVVSTTETVTDAVIDEFADVHLSTFAEDNQTAESTGPTLDARTLELLEAAGITTIGQANAYLAEHGSFVPLKGIGKATDAEIRGCLSRFAE